MYYWKSAGFDFVIKIKQAITIGETGWGVLKTTLCYSFESITIFIYKGEENRGHIWFYVKSRAKRILSWIFQEL